MDESIYNCYESGLISREHALQFSQDPDAMAVKLGMQGGGL